MSPRGWSSGTAKISFGWRGQLKYWEVDSTICQILSGGQVISEVVSKIAMQTTWEVDNEAAMQNTREVDNEAAMQNTREVVNEAAMWNTREAVIRVTMVEVDMPKWFQQKNRNRVEIYRVDNYELDYRSLRKDFSFLNFSSGDVTDAASSVRREDDCLLSCDWPGRNADDLSP